MPIFKALSITERKQKTPLTILDFNEPSLGAKEILVETVVAAQNPIDWKQLDCDVGIPYLPWTNGGDIAGVVYKVGSRVTRFRPGDRVICYLTRTTPRHGGYQTYSLAVEDNTVSLPDHFSFEGGSTIPMAFFTAASASMGILGMKFPTFDGRYAAPGSTGKPLLVWGGSGSVGSYAIQVAKLSGYTVLTTASPKNFDYVKSLGADYAFDYHEANVVNQIRAAGGSELSLVYDSIADQGSTKACVESITSTSGGTVVVVGSFDPILETPTIKIVRTGPAPAVKPNISKAVYEFLDGALRKKVLIPNRAKVMPGGLRGVNEGFELGRRHKISGEKLVYRVGDTKF